MTRRLKRTGLLALALLVPAALTADQVYFGFMLEGVPVSFWAVFAVQLCHWETWTVAGPIVAGLERRWPLQPPHKRRSLVKHLIAAPIVAVTVILCSVALFQVLIRLPIPPEWFANFNKTLKGSLAFFVLAYGHFQMLIYAAIVAVANAKRSNQMLRERDTEALRLRNELADARLTTLRTQLQPHFLFNTLHTIGSLVMQRQNQRAVELIAELGELLRTTLAHRDTDLAPLGEELAHLRRYLRIEEARFSDRLTVTWDIEDAALGAMIPPFILQPIVENAFRHGISKMPGDVTLRIAARREEGELRVVIDNDGPPLPAGMAAAAAVRGYGLRNVRERLAARRPPGRLLLEDRPGGVRVTVSAPVW